MRAERGLPLLAAATLAFAGCGGDSGSEGSDARGVGEARVGSVAALADCRDWNRGTAAERKATIDDVRRQINLEDSPVEGPALTDEQAYGMFERTCAKRHAAGFKLYKLYARAVAVQPLVGGAGS